MRLKEFKKEHCATTDRARIEKGGTLNVRIPFINDGDILRAYEAYPVDGVLLRLTDETKEFLIKKKKLPSVKMADGTVHYNPPQIRACLNAVEKDSDRVVLLDLPRTAVSRVADLDGREGHSIFESVIKLTKISTGKKVHEVEWQAEFVEEAARIDDTDDREFYDLDAACVPHDLVYIAQRLGLGEE